MTIAEFVTELQKYPQDLEIYLHLNQDEITISQRRPHNTVGAWNQELQEMIWVHPREFKRIEPDYTISLQRAIEHHCNGKIIPKEIADLCPHHAEKLNKYTAKATGEQR